MFVRLWVYFVFFSLTSSLDASTQPTFGLFKGLGDPFEGSGYAHLSPVVGLDKAPVKGKRRHGHMGLNPTGFVRPTGRCVDPIYCPQDAMASILERLFPTHIGFVVNQSNADKVNKWLKPRCIALIFNAIYIDHVLELSDEDAKARMAAAMQPDLTENHLKREANRAKHHGVQPKPIEYSKESLGFAWLLLSAWRDNWGEKACLNGYPKNVVEEALLVYMWEKMQVKSDLRPFIEALSDRLLNRHKANDIIWEGQASQYNREDFEALSHLDAPYTCEQLWLQRLGHRAFIEKYPPVLEYGMSYVQVQGKPLGVSNCGDIMLLVWMMHLVAKPQWDEKDGRVQNHRFDCTVLEKLKAKDFKVSDRLIEFFKKTCPSYDYAYDQNVWNAWSALISNLNNADDPEIVQYMHPTPEKGTYGLGAGIDNVLTVLGKLVKHPKWTRSGWSSPDLTAERLDLVCEAFSPCYLNRPEGDHWYWKVIRKGCGVPFNDRDLGDPKDVTVLLLLGEKPVLELNCIPKHFEAIAASASSLRAPGYEEARYSIRKDISQSNFPSYFYADEMESIGGKLVALHRAAWYGDQFHSRAFDHVFERWIDKTGSHFAGYEDEHTNTKLIEILYNRAHWSVDQVMDLGSLNLAATLMRHLVQVGDVGAINRVLFRDLCFYRKLGSPLINTWLGRTRVLSRTLPIATIGMLNTLSQAELDPDAYLFMVAGSSLLHMIALGGTVEAAEHLVTASGDPNAQDLSGNTPLHYGSQNHKDIVSILLKQKVTHAVLNKVGETPLCLAIRFRMPMEQLLCMARGIAKESSQLFQHFTPQGQTLLGLALERFMGHPDEPSQLVEFLVEQGAYLNPDFWTKNLFAPYLLSGRLSNIIYQTLRSKK